MTLIVNNDGVGISQLVTPANTSDETASLQIRDGLDFPHSGVFKALYSAATGNYALRNGAAGSMGFNFTYAGGTSPTVAVAAGKIFKDGKYVSISALSAHALTRPTSGHFYHLVVVKADNSMDVRISTVVDDIPELTDGDIPIGLVKVAHDANTGTASLPTQFFTSYKTDNTLSIGYLSSNAYTETLSIASNSGDTDITATVQDKDIKFIGNDGGGAITALTLDMSEAGKEVFSAGAEFQKDITIYEDANNADVSLSLGTSATESLNIEVLNGTSNKTAEEIRITTKTASATANHSKISIYIDEVEILDIDDGGIDLASGKTFAVNGTDVVGADNLNSLGDAVIADGDSIVFIDADDSNASKKETLSDFLDVVAGTVATTGLDRSGATLVVSDLHPVGVNGSANQLLTDDGDGTVTSESKLTFDGSTLTVDTDFTGTTTATTKGAHIDFDATGITASGQTATNIGLDLDLNSDSPTMVGTVNNTGIDVDLTGGTSGAQTNVGINVAVTGADTNYAALFSGGNVGIGEATPDTMLHLSSGSDQAPQITLENTGTDEAAPNEPEIIFKRNSTPSAEGDHDSFDIGTIKYNARDHAGTTHTFGQILCDVFDDSDGSEDGRFIFYHLYNGTNVQAFNMGAGQVVVNDGGEDINFRCETNNDANALFVDGGQDKVGIGLNAPKTKLTVEGALTLKEQADADGDTAAYGQIWVHDDTPNTLYFTNDAGNDIKLSEEVFIISLSDETTDLTTGTGKASFNMPFAMTLTGVKATVNTAPAGSTITVDINEAGSTILSTKLTIDASELTSTSAATAAVISDASLANDALITFDIDQIGSSTAGKGLKVTLYGYRT